MAKEFRNGGNFDTGSVNPSGQAAGDIWYRSDLSRLWFRGDAGNMEIFGHLQSPQFNTINATTAKTQICSNLALTVGYWYFEFWSMCSTSSGSMTTTVDFSGTATNSQYQIQNMSTAAITGAFNNTTFGSALLGSTTSPLIRRAFGFIQVTVNGNLSVSHTAATSFTVPALGANLDAKRIF